MIHTLNVTPDHSNEIYQIIIIDRYNTFTTMDTEQRSVKSKNIISIKAVVVLTLIFILIVTIFIYAHILTVSDDNFNRALLDHNKKFYQLNYLSPDDPHDSSNHTMHENDDDDTHRLIAPLTMDTDDEETIIHEFNDDSDGFIEDPYR